MTRFPLIAIFLNKNFLGHRYDLCDSHIANILNIFSLYHIYFHFHVYSAISVVAVSLQGADVKLSLLRLTQLCSHCF